MKRNAIGFVLLLLAATVALSNTASAQTVTACDGPLELNNIAEVTDAVELDTDSTPDNFDTSDLSTAEDDTAQSCTTITKLIDLELSKVVSQNVTLENICTTNNDSGDSRDTSTYCDGENARDNFIFCGDTIQYTLTLLNTGASTATGIEVTDTLPSAIANPSSSGGDSTSILAGVVTWGVNSLGKGASIDLLVEGEVTCS